MFIFGIALFLVSIPFLLFTILSIFNCGFMNNKLCCSTESQICCIGLNGGGCVHLYSTNKQKMCNQYCFEAQNKVLAGMTDKMLLNHLNYCLNNCTEFPCIISYPNGTKFVLNCEWFGNWTIISFLIYEWFDMNIVVSYLPLLVVLQFSAERYVCMLYIQELTINPAQCSCFCSWFYCSFNLFFKCLCFF